MEIQRLRQSLMLSALCFLLLLILQSSSLLTHAQKTPDEVLASPIVSLDALATAVSSTGHMEHSSTGHEEHSSTGHEEHSSTGHEEHSSTGHEEHSSTGTMDTRPSCIRFGGETATSQIDYVTAIISNAAFGNTTHNPAFKGLFSPEGAVYSWFDGSRQFRANGQHVNFTANMGNNNDSSLLLTHMVSFFGPTLGCNATGFPVYMMANTLYDIHRNMNFGQNETDYFVSQLVFGLEIVSPGISDEEKGTFSMFFSQFGRCAPSYNQTCNDMSCTLASNALPSEACDLLYPSASSDSLCSKYTYLLSSQRIFVGGDSVQNEQMLMNAIVLLAINGSSTSTPVVPGLLAADSPLLPWFNGSVKYRPDAPNYKTNMTAFLDLVSHFASYFGDLLECNAPGWNTMAYNFNMGRYDMYEVHREMGIHNMHMDYFLNQMQLALEALTFTSDDRAQFNQSTRIFYRYGGMINGFPGQICGEPDCDLAQPNDPMLYMNSSSSTGPVEPTISLCNYYFGNTTDAQIDKVSAFLALVVLGNATSVPPVEGVMSNAILKPFFNGAVIYRPDGRSVDFTANNFDNPDFEGLRDHLIHYFLHFLECEPSGMLPPIDNPEVWEIHRNMKISDKEFSIFNKQIVDAANATGFIPEHLAYLKSSLDVFGQCAPSVYGGFAQVCNSNQTGADACPASSFALTPADCYAQYVGDSVCARLTSLNYNYTNVQSEADFLMQLNTVIFNGTGDIKGLLDKNATTLLYFNGTIKYNGNDTVDYTDYAKNNDLIVNMMMKTYTHLGQLLGCSAPGFGIEAYNFLAPNQSLYAIHKGMNIDSSIFEYYLSQITPALTHLGATPAEAASVFYTLGLYRKCGVDPNGYLVEICSGDGCGDANSADCSQYPGGDSSSSNHNAIIIGVCVGVGAVLLIAVAYYCYRKRSSGTGGSTSHESQRLMTDDSDVDTYRSTR